MDQSLSFVGAVEIVDRAGHVQARVRVERLPFRIGRALDNDLVLDDSYVCPQHAELIADEHGALVLCDRGSVNGSFRGHERARSATIALGSNVDLRIGHTLLRFRRADEVLAATEIDPLASSRLMGLDRPRWALVALALSLLVLVLQTVLTATSPLRLGAVAGTLLPSLVVLAVWALAWSLVNRMVAHRFHYLGHLAVAGFGLVCATSTETLLGYLRYAFAADGWPELATLWGAIVFSTIIYGHLRLISRGKGRRLLLPTVVVGLAFLALSLLPGAGDDRFRAEPQLASTLKPPFAALRAGRTPDDYYQAVASAFDAADAQAAEESD